jgi:hypothetical protein
MDSLPDPILPGLIGLISFGCSNLQPQKFFVPWGMSDLGHKCTYKDSFKQKLNDMYF